MNTRLIARSWAIAITMSLLVGCGSEGFEQKQTQEPVQLSFSAQEIGSTEVMLPPALTTTNSPAITSLGNATYVFYKSSSDSGIYMIPTPGPLENIVENQPWPGLVRLPGSINTSHAPSVVTLNNTIYVVYKGAYTDSRIFVARLEEGSTTWGMARFPDSVSTTTRPTAFVSENSLYVLYSDSHYPQNICMVKLSDNTAWTGGGISTNSEIKLSSGISSSASSAIVALDNEAFIFYKKDSGIYMSRASGPSPLENRQWSGPIRLPGAVNTSAEPSVVTKDNTIYVVYRGLDNRWGSYQQYGNNDTRIFVVRSMDGGSTWSMAKVQGAGYSGASFPDTVNTTLSPTAHVSGDSLYVLYKGVYEDSRMFMARLSLSDSNIWEPIPY